MALQDHLELADIANQFDERTVQVLTNKRDALWERMSQSGPVTKEAQEAYDKLDAQVTFFTGMLDRFRRIMSYDAVLVDKCDKLVEAYEAGNTAEMVKMINKIKEVIQ